METSIDLEDLVDYPEIAEFLRNVRRLKELDWDSLKSLSKEEIVEKLSFLEGIMLDDETEVIAIRARDSDLFESYISPQYADLIVEKLEKAGMTEVGRENLEGGIHTWYCICLNQDDDPWEPKVSVPPPPIAAVQKPPPMVIPPPKETMLEAIQINGHIREIKRGFLIRQEDGSVIVYGVMDDPGKPNEIRNLTPEEMEIAISLALVVVE